jgi:hypothetical protein
LHDQCMYNENNIFIDNVYVYLAVSAPKHVGELICILWEWFMNGKHVVINRLKYRKYVDQIVVFIGFQIVSEKQNVLVYCTRWKTI